MRAAVAIPMLLAALAVAAFAVSGIALWWGMHDGGTVGLHMSVAFAVAAALFGAVWAVLHIKLLRPLSDLTRELVMHAQVRLDRPVAVASGNFLDELPAAVEKVFGALRAARGDVQEAVDAATRRAEEQKSRLEAILLDLSEGVIVCNLEHRILLYNQAAVRILNAHDALGLARSLFGVLTREPVLLTLELLLQQDEGATGNGAAEMIQKEARRFVCTSADLGTFLQAKLSLVREQSGRPSGYVLTFADVSAELESVAQRDALLREVAIEWRRPLASLRAAAEMLADEPQLEANERRVFQDVVCKEVDALHQRFAEVARCYERLATGPWPLADIYSLDLFRAVRRRLVADRIEVTPVGVPVWMNADSHSLVLALEFLIRAIAKHTTRTAFDIGAVARDKYVYVEVVWDGPPIASAVIEPWLAEPLRGRSATARFARSSNGTAASCGARRCRKDGHASDCRSGPPNGQPLRSGRSGLRQGRNFTISICSKSRARRLEKHRCVNSTSSYSTPKPLASDRTRATNCFRSGQFGLSTAAF